MATGERFEFALTRMREAIEEVIESDGVRYAIVKALFFTPRVHIEVAVKPEAFGRIVGEAAVNSRLRKPGGTSGPTNCVLWARVAGVEIRTNGSPQELKELGYKVPEEGEETNVF